MISIIIVLISFILDEILSLILPFMRGNLSIFTSLFVPISIYVIYPLFKNNKNYYITSYIIGMIYDLCFTNLLYFNGLLFLVIALVTVLIHKYFNINKYSNILYLIIIISLYEGLSALIYILFNIVSISIGDLVYKISHTLIINIIYGSVLYLIINKNKKKKYYS